MPLSFSALEPLLRLALVPGIGPGRLAYLIRRFGSAERALAARIDELTALPGFGKELAYRIRAASEAPGRERARRGIATLQRAEAVALTPDDLDYPESFRSVSDSPYLLFARGDLQLLRQPGFAIVGTRSPTDYGRESTSTISSDLALAGYVIVSGMAKGIDAAAHAAALDANGGTIGVLGHGIERIYPADNRRLFQRVWEEGLLLTEFAPGEEPRAGNFPRRNRLIAALSEGVLVVEMGTRSGAQHTVTYALEQGKEIFAVPGPIGATTSAGTNQLIKEGARVVTSVNDILEELEGVGFQRQGTEPGAPRRARLGSGEAGPAAAPALPPSDLSPEEARIFAALSREPRHIDSIAAAAELPTGAALAALLGLELRGLIESLPGKQFRRAEGGRS